VRHGVPPDERLRRMEQRLRSEGASLVRGGDYDAWDLELRAGLLGAARLLLATEEQGGGSQLVRLRVWPRLSVIGPLLAAGLLVLGVLAGRAGEWDAVLVLGGAVALLVVAQLREAALAVGALTALWSDDDGGAA
jgi:hypothetical protein